MFKYFIEKGKIKFRHRIDYVKFKEYRNSIEKDFLLIILYGLCFIVIICHRTSRIFN